MEANPQGLGGHELYRGGGGVGGGAGGGGIAVASGSSATCASAVAPPPPHSPPFPHGSRSFSFRRAKTKRNVDGDDDDDDDDDESDDEYGEDHSSAPSSLSRYRQDRMIHRGLNEMRQALEMIPPEEKKAFVEALHKAPKLVEIESNYERYLKYDNYNPWDAARRVVDYWNVRLELFGPDRAFLPLTLTGEGALSMEDMKVFRTGAMMILPSTVHGKATLFHDRSRLDKPEVLSGEKRLRCCFYLLSAIAETKDCAVVLTVYCGRTRKSTFDLKMIADGVSYFITRNVVPVRLEQMHYVMLSTRPVLDFVIPATLNVLEKVIAISSRVAVHSNRSVDATQDDLRKHGFSLEGLPKVPLAGMYTFGCFRRWIDDRIRKEGRLYASVWPGSTYDDDVDSKPSHAVPPPPEDDPEEEALRRRREVYAGYARRKRARKRIEAKVLQSEYDRLQKQKVELQRECRELESLLAEAHRIVALVGKGDTKNYESARTSPSLGEPTIRGQAQPVTYQNHEAQGGSLPGATTAMSLGYRSAPVFVGQVQQPAIYPPVVAARPSELEQLLRRGVLGQAAHLPAESNVRPMIFADLPGLTGSAYSSSSQVAGPLPQYQLTYLPASVPSGVLLQQLRPHQQLVSLSNAIASFGGNASGLNPLLHGGPLVAVSQQQQPPHEQSFSDPNNELTQEGAASSSAAWNPNQILYRM